MADAGALGGGPGAAMANAIVAADGAVACHLAALGDAELDALREPMAAAAAAAEACVAMSDRLGCPLREVGPAVLEALAEVLQTERGLEAARRAGGGWYGPAFAAALAGWCLRGQGGLQEALELFPVLPAWEQLAAGVN